MDELQQAVKLHDQGSQEEAISILTKLFEQKRVYLQNLDPFQMLPPMAGQQPPV